MALIKNTNYFVSDIDVVIRTSSSKKSKALNHLLLGDWLTYKGEQTASWAKVRSRGVTGWLPKSSFADKRLLEINFVDIGQGDGCHIVTPDDEIILIDAGDGNNMYRFLNWRYNLRKLKIIGVDGVSAGDDKARGPVEIDHIVISHPDQDHYYGFKRIFKHKKFKPLNIYHNSLVERPIKKADKDPGLRYYSSDDLGGYVETDGEAYIWDVINSNQKMHDLIDKHSSTRKRYLSTMRAAKENNPDVKFEALCKDDGYIDGFGEQDKLRFKVLGPITEEVTFSGETKPCLIRLGNESISKNGHSVILQLQLGKLKVMLGGDLNTQSEDYLLKHYGEATRTVSKLEERMYELQAKGSNLTDDDTQELMEVQTEIEAIIAKGRRHFQVDVTKACHHGSHHFSETFIRTLNPVVTVISSGDNESYSHPRPDALGAFGKYSRGVRPLIFSTELARNTKEFSNVFDYFTILKNYETRIAAATTKSEKKKLKKEMQERKDRNVVVYGMITLRTDGEKVIIAQKIEAPTRKSEKWDIHELRYNEYTNQFDYVRSAKAH